MKQIPPQILIGAYAEGVFPMAEDGEIYWFAPMMRGVIPVDERFHIPKGLRKSLRKKPFELRHNTAFAQVMQGCADREQTWIDEVIFTSYHDLFELGLAHSFECWDEDGLQGGLYGVRLGDAFFGESMFSRKTDASKIALVHLVEWMRAEGMTLLDTQWMTDHLRQFGGEEIPREKYLDLLAEAVSPWLENLPN
ncbi:leucyl/phenylalanyl-tRNA--protein transferase [Persicirhabdus sediminis]|uniref:Leucyl/phenylalanyl-tRNA--protein transferase n=1 Tax=Persicirhabdus sediminis TaxID=454144 RepID=A0A8J7SH51_9BACT|nr:leucyl/phenylalanyl-tRNA--protein transferase [Persicirhabdus sediminis]MBK1790560.1 leucyl/phenylalanyl-tRNA--protein transferase [Persicirhabdus sediminis]